MTVWYPMSAKQAESEIAHTSRFCQVGASASTTVESGPGGTKKVLPMDALAISSYGTYDRRVMSMYHDEVR